MSEATRIATPESPISVGQISSMQRCPQAYLFRYGHGLIEPPKWAFTIGKAVEKGIQLDYSECLREHRHLTTSDVKDATRDHLRQLLEVEPPQDKEFDPAEATDHVVETAGVFHEEVGTFAIPRALEVEVVYTTEDGLPPVRGFADVVLAESLARSEDGRTTGLAAEHERVLVDNKTSGAAGGWKPESDVAAALQPVAYVMGLEAAGQKVDGFQFHIARHASGGRWLKTKATQILDAPVTDDMRTGWKKLVRRALRQREAILETGVAMPLYGWQCKGCGYRDACKKEWGREPPK